MHSNCMVLLSQAFRWKEWEKNIYISLLHENIPAAGHPKWWCLDCSELYVENIFFSIGTHCVLLVFPACIKGFLNISCYTYEWILTNSTISTLSKSNPNIWQHQREIGCICSDGAWTWGMMCRKKEWKKISPWY